MFFLTLPKISVCILINYVPSSSTVPITRTLCHQLTVNGGIRLLQDIQWKKTGLSQVAENICSDLQHARASCAIRSRHHEDPFFIQILSLQQSFEHWAACKVAHYQHRTAWVRRDHAWPFTLRRQGREHTQNIHTIINGSSSKKHPNTTPGTGVKSGSTSGLLWSASPDTVVSSSHSGEGWQLQWKQVKKNTPFSSWEISGAIYSL